MSNLLDISRTLKVIKEKKSSYIEDLAEFIAIPSVSFPGYDKAELVRAAQYTKELLKKAGLAHIQEWTEGESPPYIFAETIRDPSYLAREQLNQNLQTILISKQIQ